MKTLAIENFKLTSLEDPHFVKPVQIHYTQNNKEKLWEAVQAYESVAVLLYHEQKESFVLVKQFRPPVYMNHKEHPFTYELCAGLIDKDLTLEEIVQEEIEEECGFNVPLSRIERINSFFTNVGISGAKQTLYYATIDDSFKIHDGGGINDEQIELVYLKLEDAKEFLFDESKAKTPGLMFSFYWFFERMKNLN